MQANSDVFYVVYLDNILIFNQLLADHEEHICWVLCKLHANCLFTK